MMSPDVDRGLRSARACWASMLYGTLVTVTDLLPPRLRYGYVHRLTRRVLQQRLPTVESATSSAPQRAPASQVARSEAVCALVAGDLDIGGIGSVVETLATRYASVGIRPVVFCTDDGRRAARLRDAGVAVRTVDSPSSFLHALADVSPDVIQLHGAPPELEVSALSSGVSVVPVLHNTEIHFTRARWAHFGRVLEQATAAIAVSSVVREFHAAHVPHQLADRIQVVANAVPAPAAPVTAADREKARSALDLTLGRSVGADVVLVCLARYDAQKNIAGMVSSFLASVPDPHVRLVVAGEPSDWVELRRADALRRCHPGADRVSLLGTSDARTLLTAADGFLLDSFFEGWPVAATEAASLGLPLILSDFGGARELISRDPDQSILIANPSGRPGAHVSDAAVARARRQCRRQPNAAELGMAVGALAARVRSGVRPVPPPDQMMTMMQGHAQVLLASAPVDGARPEQPRRSRQ